MYGCVCVCVCKHPTPRRDPPDPMNDTKIFKGWSPRDAPSELVPQWYKKIPPDQHGRVEMEKPNRCSNKTSTAWSCAEDQILENKSSEQDFKYVYWTMSKPLFWILFTSPHEKLVGIRRVSNLSTSIDPGSFKIGFLVQTQNAGFVRDNSTN